MEEVKDIRVSVIIPVYNAEKYLRECLDSVVNQTLKDIEIICINDGSTDSSSDILNEYFKNDSRFTILKIRKSTSGKARNKGIQAAKGKYIAFIDADDFYPENNVLDALYNAAEQNNVLIAGGDLVYFETNSRDLKYFDDEIARNYAFRKRGIINYRDYQFDSGFQRFIYNREFLIQNKIFFPNLIRFQDPPFFINAMFNAGDFFVIDKMTYAYRIFHKAIKWEHHNCNAELQGMLYDIKFASKNGLPDLKAFTCKRFRWNYNNHIKYHLNLKSIYLINKTAKYNSEVKYFVKQNHLNWAAYILQSLFSVKNTGSKDNVHKMWTICGIKLKFRCKNKKQK